MGIFDRLKRKIVTEGKDKVPQTDTSLVEKAELLGEGLVGSAVGTANVIMEELGTHHGIHFRDKHSVTQFFGSPR